MTTDTGHRRWQIPNTLDGRNAGECRKRREGNQDAVFLICPLVFYAVCGVGRRAWNELSMHGLQSLILFPERRGEKHQDGEEFETPDKHEERADPFGKVGQFVP